MGVIKNDIILYNVSRKKGATYSNKSLQVRVAELYVFLLPWKMIIQLTILKNIFGACANYLSFAPHMLGLYLMFIDSRGRSKIQNDAKSSLFHYFVIMIVIMNFSSFIMAIILHDKLGTVAGEDTYRAIAGQIVYYSQYIFMILYNREVFRLISKERLEEIFSKILKLLLVLGYYQILIILFGGAFSKIYDSLDIFKFLWPASVINIEQRLSLSGSEPAAAGGLICRFIVPFLMAKLLYYGRNYKTILELLLWLPVLYFTKSSTGYILIIACFTMYIILNLNKKEYRRNVIFGIFLVTFIVLICFPYYNAIINSDFMKQVNYILVDKITNKSNQDTMSRKIPLIVNYKTFLEYPILGVGNGNQGFFYLKYFPMWAYSSYDVHLLLSSANTSLANGSLFFPGILSGYGILGVILVGIYMFKCKCLVIKERIQLGLFYYMFIIGSIVILINGFSSEFVGNYGIWFILSIPYSGTIVTTKAVKEKRSKSYGV